MIWSQEAPKPRPRPRVTYAVSEEKQPGMLDFLWTGYIEEHTPLTILLLPSGHAPLIENCQAELTTSSAIARKTVKLIEVDLILVHLEPAAMDAA